MISDFRRKKLLHVFNTFLANNQSGSVTKADFDDGFKKITELRGWKEGGEAYEDLKKMLDAMWEGMQAQADSENDGELSTEAWLQLWSQFDNDPEEEAEWQALYCKFFFTVTDLNSDGIVDAEEFVKTYSVYGLDMDESTEAFKGMTGGEFEVGWKYYQMFWKEYYSTEDESAPGNYIFGKFT